MRFPRVLFFSTWLMAAGLLVAASCPPAFAQTTDYSKPASQFPNVVGPYQPRQVPAPDLANSARIDQLMKGGKLYLSLDDAIALALENNLDLAIARYNLPIADTDMSRFRPARVHRDDLSSLVDRQHLDAVGSEPVRVQRHDVAR
jgi:hypothetical protein